MLKNVALLILLMLFASGCLYTNIQRPMDKDFHTTDLGSKEGRASNHSILWLFAWGDAGTKAAAENGDISVIKHADQEIWLCYSGSIFVLRRWYMAIKAAFLLSGRMMLMGCSGRGLLYTSTIEPYSGIFGTHRSGQKSVVNKHSTD